MRIAGFEKCSLVDYPGKMAAVVFTPGCNMDCFYCHNRWIVSAGADFCAYDPEQVLEFLDTRNGLLDGVVITGGEPTLQPGLEEFIGRVRDLGYPVKLDTNGTNPARLGRLIERGLVDYVAMDLKAPLDSNGSHCDYESLCGSGIDLEAVEASVRLLLQGWVEYEFRTTVAPQLGRDDLMAIARSIRGARRYVLQQYRVPEYAQSGTGVSPVSSALRHGQDAHATKTGVPPVFASNAAQVSAAVEAFDRAACREQDDRGAAYDVASDPRLSFPPHSPYLILEWAEQIAPLVRCVQTRGMGTIDTAIVAAVPPAEFTPSYDEREESLIPQTAV
ncbi:anaerobic ribonucleoside-triphosphate reductase activating protein [Candidatus Sumerlaeota bacterium]|nr:anaerobic ribonucleoside-triphosphate reductase activating protein [Candidatus Sumerlaeota bacterium]